MAKRITRSQQQESTNTTTGAIVGATGASMVAGAGGTTLTTCPSGDTSFYCQFVKGFNIFKMILFIIAILIGIYVLYKIFIAGKKSRK